MKDFRTLMEFIAQIEEDVDVQDAKYKLKKQYNSELDNGTQYNDEFDPDDFDDDDLDEKNWPWLVRKQNA